MPTLRALAGTPVHYSYDLTGTFDQGKLVVRRVRIGHLNMMGPARDVAAGWLAASFTNVVGDAALVAAIRDVRLTADQAEVVIGK